MGLTCISIYWLDRAVTVYLQRTIPVTGRETFNIGLEFIAVLEGGALDNSPSFSVHTCHKLNGIPL